MFKKLKNWWRNKKRSKRLRLEEKGHDPIFDPEIEGDFDDDRSLFTRIRESFQRFASRRGELKETFSRPKRSGRKKLKIPDIDFKNFKDLNVSKVSEHQTAIRWGIAIIALFLLSEVITRLISVWVRPTYTSIPRRQTPVAQQQTRENYNEITNRNMFNVEGTIPDPFDQGMLDCFSQASRSSQPLTLLGTIVMKNEEFSVALVSESGKPDSLAVRKDDTFFNKYTALKVERQRLCFQVKATQDLEFIEIKDDVAGLDVTPVVQSGGGISAVSDSEFSIKRNFLDSKLANLNEILQSARAVPYVDSGGNFKGFLIQSIREDSIFFDLGVRQGDILNGVNDIELDNAGKGLEAFQRLRNSSEITLEITRGGQAKTLKYSVN